MKKFILIGLVLLVLVSCVYGNPYQDCSGGETCNDYVGKQCCNDGNVYDCKESNPIWIVTNEKCCTHPIYCATNQDCDDDTGKCVSKGTSSNSVLPDFLNDPSSNTCSSDNECVNKFASQSHAIHYKCIDSVCKDCYSETSCPCGLETNVYYNLDLCCNAGDCDSGEQCKSNKCVASDVSAGNSVADNSKLENGIDSDSEERVTCGLNQNCVVSKDNPGSCLGDCHCKKNYECKVAPKANGVCDCVEDENKIKEEQRVNRLCDKRKIICDGKGLETILVDTFCECSEDGETPVDKDKSPDERAEEVSSFALLEDNQRVPSEFCSPNFNEGVHDVTTSCSLNDDGTIDVQKEGLEDLTIKCKYNKDGVAISCWECEPLDYECSDQNAITTWNIKPDGTKEPGTSRNNNYTSSPSRYDGLCQLTDNSGLPVCLTSYNDNGDCDINHYTDEIDDNTDANDIATCQTDNGWNLDDDAIEDIAENIDCPPKLDDDPDSTSQVCNDYRAKEASKTAERLALQNMRAEERREFNYLTNFGGLIDFENWAGIVNDLVSFSNVIGMSDKMRENVEDFNSMLMDKFGATSFKAYWKNKICGDDLDFSTADAGTGYTPVEGRQGGLDAGAFIRLERQEREYYPLDCYHDDNCSIYFDKCKVAGTDIYFGDDEASTNPGNLVCKPIVGSGLSHGVCFTRDDRIVSANQFYYKLEYDVNSNLNTSFNVYLTHTGGTSTELNIENPQPLWDKNVEVIDGKCPAGFCSTGSSAIYRITPFKYTYACIEFEHHIFARGRATTSNSACHNVVDVEGPEDYSDETREDDEGTDEDDDDDEETEPPNQNDM
ncbi:hypothetical protein ACFL1H_00795 [Nanoarchaeota archaeon]